ncbi:fumarylacetoacetate hydrolase family protein [Chitinasiproducens palmae]|uniref:2-keto-4-pentenoate hydratase/2-oxohepta-3-ene-1,7-dioic acid hydratase (Catechol pathway) n=1 Tax=Chitinasiproducens palmae TaxID=1770053 RepID=A0A1H2PS10_9BURK|nr:fumarylacetoacetate hydrolase family protein [Chitinasiproducens palmae]SDV49721.1 2-keto-4-pentenoate hydratase/2-oxohepta-3-ene-1,7-dioic acid hydratase (catechol pathway) [Chitinasiproducens palmae]
MRLGTVLHQGRPRLAVAVDDGLAVLPGAAPDGRDFTMQAVIDGWPATRPALEVACEGASPVAVDTLHWLPPLPRPGKVLCVALNNSANKDRIMRGPSHPAAFVKPASSLIGHGQPIRLREHFGRVHPEPELAVVIGRTGSDIAHEAALAHVFGYTIINDLTAPTMRGEDTFHYRAIHPKRDDPETIEYVDSWVSYPGRYKGSDSFGPMGPWIATRDAIPDPHDLAVRCVHQGRLVTEDNTANLFYKVADVIAFMSTYMTLEAGDIIAMGTALKQSNGGQAVQNVDLTRFGGPIEVSISGIGTLSNPVERRA